MTAAKLVWPPALRTPERAAEYFSFGAEYVDGVCEAMDWDSGDLDGVARDAKEAMERGETDVPEAQRKLVVAVMVGDAEFWWPMGKWLPRGYALLMRGLSHALRRKLLKVAGRYAGGLPEGGFEGLREFYGAYPGVRDVTGEPEFSVPEDRLVEGRPATSYVDGVGLEAFSRQTVLGDSVLHVEWFEFVADHVGVEYDQELCERAKQQSPAYFAGVSDELDPDVRRLQAAMFSDSDWIRDFHDHYQLRSILFRKAAEGIEDTAAELQQPLET